MRILVVAATHNEIAPVMDQVSSPAVDFLITGVGMVATAYQLGRKLAGPNKYDLILNVGIAGAFDRNLLIGTPVHIVEDRFSELGAEDGEEWLSIDELGFGESTFYSNYPQGDPMIETMQPCKSVTVNRVHGDPNSIAQFKALHPDIQTESMEGAAVFYAAKQAQIPVLQVRTISNYVERRNRAAWDIPLAIGELNTWLGRYIASKIHE